MTRKTALITGGAGHIGRAICEKLAERHTDMIVLDKSAESGQAFVKDLADRFGGNHLFLNANISSADSFKQVHEAASKHSDKLDYVINNAAFYDSMAGWGGSFQEEGYDAWLEVMKVNLLAPFFLTQALHPLLLKSDAAAVVNIGSIYGVVAPDHGLYEGTEMSNPAAYGASKGGLLQLTRWLSAALAPDVRVNMVSPGGVARGQNEKFAERYCKKTPLGRMAKEQDLSGAVSFLLSDEAAYVTGQNILVDGGWTVW